MTQPILFIPSDETTRCVTNLKNTLKQQNTTIATTSKKKLYDREIYIFIIDLTTLLEYELNIPKWKETIKKNIITLFNEFKNADIRFIIGFHNSDDFTIQYIEEIYKFNQINITNFKNDLFNIVDTGPTNDFSYYKINNMLEIITEQLNYYNWVEKNKSFNLKFINGHS